MHLVGKAAELASKLKDNAASIDVEGRFPIQEMQWLHENGLLSSQLLCIPTHSLLSILWHIGRGNLTVGRLFEGHVNALQLVQWFGSTQQRKRLFADADAGKLFAVWNTQDENGLSFEPNSDHWLVQGGKTFCSGVGNVARPIVTGRSVDGWQMAVLQMEHAAVEINSKWWQPLGMRSSASFQADFSGTRIEHDDLLGGADDYYCQPAFSGGALRFCAVQLGGAAALFDETRRFLKATGRTDDAFQQSRIGQMARNVQSGLQWLNDAATHWDAQISTRGLPDEKQSLVPFAAMMRIATEEICTTVMHHCERCIGARGLLRNEPFERMLRDLTMYLKQPHLDEIPCRVGRFALESTLPSHQLWEIPHSDQFLK